MAPLGIGLIGLGRHGIRYAQHVLEHLPQARLVAVSRQNVAQGYAFAQQHNIRFYSNWHNLIADRDVEAIVVVTLPFLHLPITLEAVHHRKPLLIEKPLAITGDEARQIVQATSQANIPVMTAQTLRYDASIQKLKEVANNIGIWQRLIFTARQEPRPRSPEQIQGWRVRGALLELGVHFLDFIRFFTGEEVAEVDCKIKRLPPQGPDDEVSVKLKTQTGIPCVIDVSRVSENRVTTIEILGDTGRAIADWTTATVQVISQGNKVNEHRLTPTLTIVSVLKEFLQALEERTPMPITAWDGQRAVELADACYESAATGQAVRLIQS